MPDPSWQRRTNRARRLQEEIPAAKQILSYYEAVLNAQCNLFERVRASNARFRPEDWRRGSPAKSDDTMRKFQNFLTVAAENGPSAISEAATALHGEADEILRTALERYWTGTDPLTGDSPAPFIFVAFLQPYAAATALDLPPSDNHTTRVCPVCRHRPGVAVLRPLGDGGKRSLICSFCLSEWEFRRVVCAGCGEEDYRKLPVFLAEAPFAHIRLECCDSCKQYLKAIDLTRNGNAEPIVDEIASVSLDLWARERSYSKIALNLMGL